ncbi:MAG: hypothetical protein ACI8UO_002623 [Verrucomicrobiales bacterium]|jgi:hypothetical protein
MTYRDPPPHFRGLDTDREVTTHRRNLPHWRQDGATYFVTYRLSDSLPDSRLEELRDERERLLASQTKPLSGEQLKEFALLFSKKVEHWLDAGWGSCVLADSNNAQLVSGCASALRLLAIG